MGEDILELDTERIENFIDRYLELDRRTQQPYGVFSFLSGRREKKYQQTLKYFLDPHKPHGFGYTLLEVFLEVVGTPKLNVAQHVELEEEVHIADDSSESRIDLVICSGQALDDHPDWAVFLELKVGADENENQTPTYAAADSWQFTWFDTTEITVDELDEATYVYVKKAAAEPPEDDEFDAVDWAAIAETFDHRLQGSLFQYPNRSVIQFTDFIQSLQETENMDSPPEEDELTERLKLYFEYDDVIHQVEQAHRQFENDFDDVSNYLTARWADKIRDQFDMAGSRWKIRSNDSSKWQGLMPEYWDQDPFGWDSTIALYFRIPPTTEHLRSQKLSFRLRLPPQRKVHKQTFEGDGSFNAVFTEKCTEEYGDEIRAELEKLDVDEIQLGRASALFIKNYDLDPENLVSSYFAQVTTAVDEFCSENSQLLKLMNSVFEASYEDVFGKPPTGEFSGPLSKRE
ncbi:PD-(D/E)XK nuclease family protein [Halorussus aquaticus]|uniref:PD-(D/E)XK nuclease family protein n=1 Tax=Halorussus aquaticus TaxID=2953748 RepID=A0ABD5Q8N1_9EURY|nr:PD-(D/E)XK nuclease family protein [Halorussus aquaticus]